MTWFIIRYILWLILLFALFFHEAYSPFYSVQSLQTDLTIYLTQLWINWFEIPVKMVGNTIYLDHGFNIWILDECNGLLAYLLFAVGIVAYPTPWVYRFIWLLESYVYLVFVNSARIDFVVYATMFDASYFYCAHDCFGRLAMVATILMMFILFTARVQITRHIRNMYDRRRYGRDRRHAKAHQWREAKEERRHNHGSRRKQPERRAEPPKKMKL